MPSRLRRFATAAVAALPLLAAPVTAQEVWRLARTEMPAIEWRHPDGRFTRTGGTAHYVREPNGERFDVQFTWQVPEQVTAGVVYPVEMTADVVAGWPCRPFYLAARIFLGQTPCAFCADGREVGAGICAEHGEGPRSFRIEPGNFGQAEARLSVHATDGGQFGGIVVTYVYARGAAATPTAPPTPTRTTARTATRTASRTATRTGTPPGTPTATATRTRTPSGPPTATATRTRTSSGPPTASRTRTRTATERSTSTPTIVPTRTPTGSQPNDLACGETREGVLDGGDPPLFNVEHGDRLFFTLGQTTDVVFAMRGQGFAPYLALADATYPDAFTLIAQQAPPLADRLPAGRYAISAGTLDAIIATPLPYSLTMFCDGAATPTATPSRTISPTPSRTPSPSPTPTLAAPTATRIPPTASGTPLPTRTLARTVTPTATLAICEIDGDGGVAGIGGCTVDIVADAIEVVQAIQDLENSVDLVAHKRTFVRLHVHALGRDVKTTATLRLELGGPGGLATDLSHPPIIVRQRPERGLLKDSFLFELPSLYLSGDVFLTATVNAENVPRESTRGNNTRFATIGYEEPHPFELVLYAVSGPGGRNAPLPQHLRRIPAGLESMYPIAEPLVWHRTLTIDRPVDFVRSNRAMETIRLLDLARQTVDTPGMRARHFALWDDVDQKNAGSQDRVLVGLAGGVPSSTASGAGIAPLPGWDVWDKDGSQADNIAAHELGHTLGRAHAEFCGAAQGRPFPHAHGTISPERDGPGAIWGFDPLTRALHPPFARDIMTYCRRLWISDVTYAALLDEYLPAPGVATSTASADERLLVVGTIDARTGLVTLEPVFRMPVLVADEPVADSAYSINQYGAGGALLARHPIAPRRMEPLVVGGDGTEGPELLLFSATVPAADGAARLAILGPDTAHAVDAGMTFPQVTVLQPDRRTTLAADPIRVAWAGFDTDGDPLTYRLQYSPDDRTTWITVAAALTDTQIDVHRSQLRASTNGRFRVWVSDGLHTSFGDSGSFILTNIAPSADIVEPAADATVLAGQTVTFVGNAYDVDQGPVPSAQLRWRSSRDGVLGSGRVLGVADLTVGEHVISFEVRDADDGVSSDAVTVRVVATAAELPPAADELVVAPDHLIFDTRAGVVEATVSIDNQGTAPLAWRATSRDPWIALDSEEGRTRAQLRVGLGAGLDVGTHAGTIVISRTDGGPPVEIVVEATVGACPGDCNADGVVTIDELLSGVNLLLTGAGSGDCRALDVNDDGGMTIDELIRAINSALAGCG